MKGEPIGIFDSGLGGLTVARRIIEALPCENVVYFGDTARVPYGTRTDETIIRYARQDMAFLRTQNVKLVVAACGTVSSVAGKLLESETDIPFFEMIAAGAKAAAEVAPQGHIGIIGTSATIRSHSHAAALKALAPHARVTEQACPLFVSLVETGHASADDPISAEAVKFYLAPFVSDPPEALILGCTHFPLLSEAISRILPDTVLIDPAVHVACDVKKALSASRQLNPDGGKLKFFVSDRPEAFESFAASALSGKKIKCEPPVNIDLFQ